MDRMYQSTRQAAKKIYERFIKLKGAPREIALGFAMGIFVGMSPFFGFHIAISVVLASLLGWSKIAAAIGVQITNVATAPLIYPITYWVGSRLTGFARHIAWPSTITFDNFFSLLRQSPQIILDLCVGGAVLGLPLAVAGYYLAHRAITAYRRRVRVHKRIPGRRQLESAPRDRSPSPGNPSRHTGGPAPGDPAPVDRHAPPSSADG